MSEEIEHEVASNGAILEFASDIVSAYVSNNAIQSGELPDLIRHRPLTNTSPPP
mgnify:CR=1 FL=1